MQPWPAGDISPAPALVLSPSTSAPQPCDANPKARPCTEHQPNFSYIKPNAASLEGSRKDATKAIRVIGSKQQIHWRGVFRQNSTSRQSSTESPCQQGWRQPHPHSIPEGHPATPGVLSPCAPGRPDHTSPPGERGTPLLACSPSLLRRKSCARLMSGGITSHKGQASWRGRGGGVGRKGKRSPGQRQMVSTAPCVCKRGSSRRQHGPFYFNYPCTREREAISYVLVPFRGATVCPCPAPHAPL